MEGSKLIDLTQIVAQEQALIEMNTPATNCFSLDLLTDFLKLFRRLRMWVLTTTMTYVRSYQSIRLIDYDDDDQLIDVTSDAENAAATSKLQDRFLDIINMANELYMMSKSLTDAFYNAFVEEAEIGEYYAVIANLGTKLYGAESSTISNWVEHHRWEVRE